LKQNRRTSWRNFVSKIRAKKDTYQHSFFPRSIREWNQVPSSVVDAGSLEDFGSCPGNSHRQSELPAFVLALCLLWW
jgi:hypothetical protein